MLKYFEDYPHSRDALIYAYDVVKEHQPACKEVKQACQRFIDDLQGLDGYWYSPQKAEKVCTFIEKLPHTKGKWAAKKESLILERWQKFIACNIFGWIDENELRRFRKVYLKVPRKNGKSLFVAAIGHYMFSQDDEYGAEIYCGATTEKQAWEVFTPAKIMAQRTPRYIKKCNIEVNAKTLTILANGSKFAPLIGKPGDGASPSCAIADEYHEHQTDEFVSTMETGMGARDQPLLLMVTTAGDNIAGPCYDTETECKKMLDGVFSDEREFAVIYGIDVEDDWTSESALIKANPNYDVSITGEFLRAQQDQAKRNANKQNAFKRKHMNMWVGAHTAFFNLEEVNSCAEMLQIEDYIDDDCIIAVDLASRVDVVATPLLFFKMIEGKRHYYYFSKFYIPEETVFEDGNEHYQRWVNDKHLIATDGNEVDFTEIQSDIESDLGAYSAREVTYDPWRATQLAQGLQNKGATIVEFRNTVANMSPAMYELEAAIKSGRFHFDGNPMMTWMFSNVVAKIDAKDNVYPRKQKPQQKIDGVVAAIMAIGRAMVDDQDLEITASDVMGL